MQSYKFDQTGHSSQSCTPLSSKSESQGLSPSHCTCRLESESLKMSLKSDSYKLPCQQVRLDGTNTAQCFGQTQQKKPCDFLTKNNIVTHNQKQFTMSTPLKICDVFSRNRTHLGKKSKLRWLLIMKVEIFSFPMIAFLF